MTDRRDDMTWRIAELAECSLRIRSTAAELMAESEQLAYRFAEARKVGARVLQQIRERRARSTTVDTGGDMRGSAPAPTTDLVLIVHGEGGPPDGSLAGDVPVAWLGSGAVTLDPDEAVALVALLEELAAGSRLDPLRGQAFAAAALLRQRVAAGHRHRPRPQPGGPEARRETGDTRDDSAKGRDDRAGERDRRADDRDDRSVQRDRLAEDAEERARAAEQRVGDLLWDAELRDKDAAEHAAAQLLARGGAEEQRWQLDQEQAQAGRTRNAEDREAIRDLLSGARVDRQAAWRGRHADGQDRLASRRDRRAARDDRQAATADRHAARADRDQAVIEGEQEDPPGTSPGK